MTTYILTLQFDTEVETGDRDISDIENMVISSYSEHCGSKVKVVDRKMMDK